MKGENAALIVQAEEHILNARHELYIAMNRLRDLERRVSPNTASRLEDIRINVQAKINSLDVEQFQDSLHVLWETC
jgi:hypothetical protein